MFEFKFINWELVRQSNDGRQYDNLTVPFVVRNVPAGWSWELLIRHGADLNIIPMVESSSGELSYALTASDLAFRGEYAVQLRATSGELVKHTSIETIYVPDSLSGDAQWPTLPTVFSEAVASAENAADRAEAAAEAAEAAMVGKLDAPETPGTAGQVLTLGENGDPEWADPQGGGGGTEDHRQLSHRNDADQHPISAITGLRDELDEISDVQGQIDDIVDVIPDQASASNQLADKDFVNSTVGTNTAYYISNAGQPFNSLAELQAYSGTVTNNDYAFVVGTDAAGNTTYTRYKYNSNTAAWGAEYVLNNSSFTASQWSAIQSGITALLVQSYNAHLSNNDIHVTAEQKQLWNAKYTKPEDGMPLSDLDPNDIDTTVTEDSENLITSGAVYAVAEQKKDKPSEVTSGTSITLADNTEYRLANVTTLTIAYPSGNFECWMRISTASSGTITITLPTSQYIGDAPTFGNGETWELSIKDGYIIANKVGA